MSRPINNESVFRAIAHPVRRKIIELLAIKRRAASELLEAGRMTMPTLSHHLQALRSVGVVSFRRRGTSLEYELHKPALKSVQHWIDRINIR